ncbi:hypothetical protein HN784_00495 [bacterium]|jgi:hypothetical protein|nr:hypothetical protein [bacterium]MBT4251559.1 hypothetical protein [bacterium]MBT4597608.1 hypothetical protein [bacterium]MBT6753622.1 hypothetical protein [bacterium]MBT7037759.1 hypothetical protein [bacterium]
MYTLKKDPTISAPQKNMPHPKSFRPAIAPLKKIPQKLQQPKPLKQVIKKKKIGSLQTKTLLSWQALKFESTPKSTAWYVVIFVILVSLVALGLFSDNFPLAILAILIGLILYLFEKKESQYFKFGITTEGIFAQDRIYKFSSLDNFWIFYKPNGRKDLSLKSKKSLIPYIQIPLGDVDPSTLREALLDFIPEVEHEEAIADSLERLI